MERDHTKAEQTIKRLQTELKSEKEEHKQAKAIIKFLKKQCVEKIQKESPPKNKVKTRAAGGGVGLGGSGSFRSKPIKVKMRVVRKNPMVVPSMRRRPTVRRTTPMRAVRTTVKKAAAKKNYRRYRRRIQGLDGIF